jgi:phosphoglucosamine mutase
MSNLGLEHALARLDIAFARAAVGDRYVLELLQNRGWQLGGETSGHIICLDKHTTGDGIVSALQVLQALQGEQAGLAELVSELALYPQVLLNVRVAKSFDFENAPEVKLALEQAGTSLDGTGRVLLRASGTEPVIRVMVEGQSAAMVREVASGLANAVKDAAKKGGFL